MSYETTVTRSGSEESPRDTRLRIGAVSRAGGRVLRSTILLQAAAAILIANSHLEGLYPKAWMAADGFIGNSIFFMLSGYGLTLSLLGREQSFGRYYLRRILRIYPALWLVEIVFHFLLQGAWKSAGWRQYGELLVYPTAYGYVRQIMVFYVLLYFLRPVLRGGMLLNLFGFLWLPLLGLYAYDLRHNPMDRLQLGATNGMLWWVFFFQIMLLGSYLALRDRKPSRLSAKARLLLLSMCLAAYVGLKFMMVLGTRVPGTGFTFARLYIVLFVLIPPMLYLAFTLGTSAGLLEWLRAWRPASWLVALIGGLTLEIYLVHFFVFEYGWVRGLVFPMNIAVFFVVTIMLAWAINAAVRQARRAPRSEAAGQA